MEPVPYSKITKGTFLIATPDIQTGLFFRSVILLCEHSPNGSFGLVVNKKLEIELPEDMIDLKNVSNPNVDVRASGPVQTNQMMLLHNSNTIPQQTLEVCEGVYLGGDLQFLQQSLTDQSGPSIRLCFGYAGWGAGQLEREFLDGQWYLFPGSEEFVFETAPDKLWQGVLREMGGKYAAMSMIPEDLSLN